MNRRKEPCRNFQRGSCQYGDRCKFLHVTQQQQKPNPFGLGAQGASQFNHQQQKPNPFGFGVQSASQFNQQQQTQNSFGFGVENSSQSKGTFDSKNQSPIKDQPFNNKWTRFSPISSGNLTPAHQTDNQHQVANHKCTDPESCKRLIAEDFEHERPLWRLTCYGHTKNLPCDIYGDISYEELRAAAYEDARMGKSLQAIVERERNLLNSKMVEFENLLRNPYVIPSNPSSSVLSPFPGTNNIAPSVVIQNNSPISVSSFRQLGPSINSGSNTRPFAASPNAFGQPSPMQMSNPFGGFGTSGSTFGSSGTSGSQPSTYSFGSSQIPNNLNINNAVNFGSSISSSQVPLFNFPNSANNLSTNPINMPKDATNATGDDKKLVGPEEMAIWLKEKWKQGEIPEEPPPDSVIW